MADRVRIAQAHVRSFAVIDDEWVFAARRGGSCEDAGSALEDACAGDLLEAEAVFPAEYVC